MKSTTMVSFRFPFNLFSQPAKQTPRVPSKSSATSRPFNAAFTVAFAAGAGAVAGIATASQGFTFNQQNSFLQNALTFFFTNHSLPLWGSLSLADSSNSIVDSRTGVSFPSTLSDSRRLLGIGLRKKSILGLKNIQVYAFGVYADDNDVKKLVNEKYEQLSTPELIENKEFYNDLLESDVCMTVRLQIIYSKLSIRSVRSAFEESIGSRLRKFGGSDNKELLQRFTSQFKDEFKIPRGSVIDLSRDRGYILHTRIDGKDVGSIESKLLCRSIFDLYIGDDPFDKQAKEDVKLALASLLQK